MNPRLDLRLLEVFCHVYECRSISRAATRLLLSQPTISGHIKNLEHLLDVKLFDRLPRRLAPTPAADLIYRHGQAILGHRDAALQELKQFLNSLEGWLHLVSSTIPGEYWLPKRIAAFRRRFSGARISVKIVDSSRVQRRILQGKEELGFSGAKLDAVHLSFIPFAVDRLALIAPNQPPWSEVDSITADELVQIPLLAREEGSGTRMAFEKSIGRSLDDLNTVAVLGSTNAVKEALKNGMGLSVLSMEAVEEELKDGRLKTIRLGELESVPREFYVVRNNQLTLSPIARAFLDAILPAQETDDYRTIPRDIGSPNR